MKSILIIGMGKFGHHLCADLIKKRKRHYGDGQGRGQGQGFNL